MSFAQAVAEPKDSPVTAVDRDCAVDPVPHWPPDPPHNPDQPHKAPDIAQQEGQNGSLARAGGYLAVP